MIEFNIIFSTLTILTILIIIVFCFALLSNEVIFNLMLIIVFLILLVPFYSLITELKILVVENNLNELAYFDLVMIIANIMISLAGIILFINFVYLLILG